MELAHYSVQYPASNLLALAQMVVSRVRVRAINMVWDDVSHLHLRPLSHLLELAHCSIQYLARFGMALAQMVVSRVRVRIINMVWRDGRKHAMGTCTDGLVAYPASTSLGIGSNQAIY